jgi:hypothetical protein
LYNKNDISILYITCYLYKNLWNPFIKNIEKYLNNINVYFCTDLIIDKNFKINLNENITLLEFKEESNMNSDGNYLKRLLHYLYNIDSKYILFFVDDMFLHHFSFETPTLGGVLSENEDTFSALEMRKGVKTYPDLLNLLNLMKSNNNIVYSKLSHNS